MDNEKKLMNGAIMEEKKSENMLQLVEEQEVENEQPRKIVSQLEKKQKETKPLQLLELERDYLKLASKMMDLNQTLKEKCRRDNLEVQEARKELVNGLESLDAETRVKKNRVIGVKRMGDPSVRSSVSSDYQSYGTTKKGG